LVLVGFPFGFAYNFRRPHLLTDGCGILLESRKFSCHGTSSSPSRILLVRLPTLPSSPSSSSSSPPIPIFFHLASHANFLPSEFRFIPFKFLPLAKTVKMDENKYMPWRMEHGKGKG
jgi:hypothetical protein